MNRKGNGLRRRPRPAGIAVPGGDRRRGYWVPLACCIAVLAVPGLAADGSLPEDTLCTTVPAEGCEAPGAVVGTNLATTSPVECGRELGETGGAALEAGMEPTHDWQLVDVFHGRRIVPESGYFALYFDRADESLIVVPPEDTLTELAHQALDYAPEWLYDDLYTNLSRFGDVYQDRAAQAILDAGHPYVDEVAFQVAHISYFNFIPLDEALLEVNARLCYDNDEYLNYVNIVDYGAPPGDYYSTVEYCVLDSGVETWIEMPREIYYWYIVHPKCSDEAPKMDSEVYGEFWREFLFDYTHPDYLDRELFDVLSQTQVVWDREEHDTLDGGRPFSDDDMALDVIGNWVSRHVPNQASSPRPIQPNLIITDHNGNCGELQDLLCAGTRTALIPCISAMDICEDHVWCEFWDDGWHPYQVSWGAPAGDPPSPGPTHIDNYGICYDPDSGGGKEVSGIWDWRNDHYNYQVIDRYSEYCTLDLGVSDLDGNPVDGAFCKIATDGLYGGQGWTAWDTTDSTGRAFFVLGDDDPGYGPEVGRDYYLKVSSAELGGGYPQGSGTVKIIDDAQAGEHYVLDVQLENGGTMPLLPVSEADPPSDPADQYKLEVDYDLPWEYKFGENVYGTTYTYHNEGTGNFELFFCDEANYQSFVAGEPFEAYGITEDSGSGSLTFTLPDNDRWYVVFSNYDQVNCAQVGDVTVRLYLDQDALDIELADFYARGVEEGVELHWSTAAPLPDLAGWNVLRREDSAAARAAGPGAVPVSPGSDPVAAAPSGDWRPLNGRLLTGDSPFVFTDTGASEGETYSYMLEAVAGDGSLTTFGPVSAVAGGEATPARCTLSQNFPNPFTGESTIRYSLPERAHVRLSVYGIEGRLVGTLVDGIVEAGVHEVVFRGDDGGGAPLPSGVYLYRLQAGDFTTVKRLLIVR
jgi:hypothetical protein